MKCPRCLRDYDPSKDGAVCWFCFYRMDAEEVADLARAKELLASKSLEELRRIKANLPLVAAQLGLTVAAGEAEYGPVLGVSPSDGVPDMVKPDFDQARVNLTVALRYLERTLAMLNIPYTSPQLEEARRWTVYSITALRELLDGGELVPLK